MEVGGRQGNYRRICSHSTLHLSATAIVADVDLRLSHTHNGRVRSELSENTALNVSTAWEHTVALPNAEAYDDAISASVTSAPPCHSDRRSLSLMAS